MKIVDDPDGYLDYWNLEEEEGIDASQMKIVAIDLTRYVDEIKFQSKNT
jgi:hypothetical protein